LKKKPKVKIIPQITKTPRIAPQNSPESILQRKPSWRFGMLDLDGPWGWLNIQSKDLIVEIMEKLKHFESMTWGEIHRNKKSHPMALDKIAQKALSRLKERELDDLDVLYSLRLSGKERIWGKRENEAFYIIWWDSDHSIYPVQKKHT
jgi:hypothetical protein